MQKFTINTVDGLKQVDAIPFRFKSPKWLRRFRFITHRSLRAEPNPGYTLTDIQTGRRIASGYAARAEVKKAGRKKLIFMGRADFLARRRQNALTKQPTTKG